MKFHGAGKRAVGVERNDAEFAASCIAELIVAGILPPTGDVMRRSARALTINVQLVVDAYTARRTGHENWQPIDVDAPALEVTPAGRVMPVVAPRRVGHPAPSGGKGRISERLVEVEGGEPQRVRLCARCKQWKAIDEFGVKDKKSDRRISYCRPCKVEYSRDRYLTVRKLDALDRAGLAFVITQDDLLCDMRCAVCGEFFSPGETVRGEMTLIHARHRPNVDLRAVEE